VKTATVTAIGQPCTADIGNAERESTIGPDILWAGLSSVRKSRLNEKFGDEANGPGVVGALAEFVIDEWQGNAAESNPLILIQDHSRSGSGA
jgi:hypothetical protein